MYLFKIKSFHLLILYALLLPAFLLTQRLAKGAGSIFINQNLESLQLLVIQFLFFLLLYPLVHWIVKKTNKAKQFISFQVLFSFIFVISHIFLTWMFFNMTGFEPFNHEFLKHFKKFFFNFSHIQFVTFWFFVFIAEYSLKGKTHINQELASEIYLVEAADHYLKLKTINSEKLERQSLTKFVQNNSKYGIIRVHKSYAININNIDKLIIKNKRYLVRLNSNELIPVGRTFLRDIKQYL